MVLKLSTVDFGLLTKKYAFFMLISYRRVTGWMLVIFI